MTHHHTSDDSAQSQAVLNQIVLEYLRDQKRRRVWQWIKRGFIVLLMLWFVYQLLAEHAEEVSLRARPHVGLIDLNGGIFENQEASADNFSKSMERAYENKALKAIIVRIDSPGGSPVQADYMYNTIRYHREKYPDTKIYAVCVDACVSAAYYVAAASEKIYANPSSMVGSIGVLYNGFGFVDTLQKLGVTRRLVVAGRSKGFMDPFSPLKPAQEKNLHTMLQLVHEQFIDQVKKGRGDRLKIDDEIFSGLFWTGVQAKERGLIDGFASSGQLARDIIKIEDVVDYTYKPSMVERVAKSIGIAMVDQLPTALGMRMGLQ